ncbi:MAG: S-formylglutathione hydrolase [Pseudomonadota bacterium]
MTLEILSENKCFDGVQGVYRHAAKTTQCDMTFAVFMPSVAQHIKVPCLWYLSGLTCTHENAMTKAGAQAWAEEFGMAIVFPDTSPRGEGVADDEAYDLGQGAGFYINATQDPWAPHFQMEAYVTDELQKLVMSEFNIEEDAQAITGHSMGGHGALTLGMKNPDLYKSVSAFAPICNPTQSDWGKKQFQAYLGKTDVPEHDATELMKAKGHPNPMLVDVGADDNFWDLLGTAAFAEAAATRKQDVTNRIHAGYDHSYWFVSTFMEDHIAFHAEALV